MNKLKSRRKRGMAASGAVMLLQGWEGIILTFFALIAFFAGVLTSPAFAAASLFGKEIFTFIITVLVFGNKNLLKIYKKGFTLSGLKYGIAFILGSSIGGVFFILSIALAGPGLGTVLTAMYPVFTTIILRVFFKDKSNKKVLFGIFLTIIGGGLFLLVPPLMDGEGFSSEKMLGMAFGAITALFWSLEGVLISKVKKNSQNWSNRELAVWKSTVSLLFIGIIIMPLGMIWENSYNIFANIFSTWEAIVITFALAINLITLRILFTYSIRNAGVKVTSVIDTNNFLIGPIFSIILYSMFSLTYANDPSKQLFQPIVWWSWLMLIPILVGVIIVVLFSEEKTEIVEYEK